MAQTTIKQRQIAGGLDGWIPAEQTWTYSVGINPDITLATGDRWGGHICLPLA